jgi:hypothetical protein
MAAIAILSWPIFALIIFAKRPVVPAILAATVLPYLFLPEAYSIALPNMPDLGKTSAISVGLIAGLLLFGNRARSAAELPTLKTEGTAFRFVLFALLGAVVLGSVATILNNGELLVYGPRVLPAMQLMDAIGRLSDLVILAVPFFVARKYLATPEMHRVLLKVLVLSALGYSLLMLVELRLSPQLHNWVYGYHQHSFLQHIRDGFRPMVFLEHGIWVGFFIFMALLSAAALWKAEKHYKWLMATGWIFIILMVSENLGAFAVALLCLAVFFGLHRKMQMWFVIVVALATVTYPALRQAQLIPIDRIMTAAESVSADRASSLRFRLMNEDELLERALEKPLTGWGSWGRDRIYDGAGRNLSVTDGLWIIILGAWGWIGYIGFFGVLAAPLVFLAATARRKEIPPETIALALICAGNFIYLVPNATLTPIGLLCFGALAGFAQFDQIKASAAPVDGTDRGRRPTYGYTRFPHKTAQRQTTTSVRS